MPDVSVDRTQLHRVPPPMDIPSATTLDLISDRLGRLDPGKVTVEIPGRPGFGVTFSLAVDGNRLAGWRMQCKDEHMPGETDSFLLNRIIVGQMCIGMVVDGNPLVDEDNRPITFKSESLWEKLRVHDTYDAVRALYGGDGSDFHISAAASKILVKAGFGEEAKEMDPTQKSSIS